MNHRSQLLRMKTSFLCLSHQCSLIKKICNLEFKTLKKGGGGVGFYLYGSPPPVGGMPGQVHPPLLPGLVLLVDDLDDYQTHTPNDPCTH